MNNKNSVRITLGATGKKLPAFVNGGLLLKQPFYFKPPSILKIVNVKIVRKYTNQHIYQSKWWYSLDKVHNSGIELIL